jgi:hypothetical protein
MRVRRAAAVRIAIATIGALALLAWGSHVPLDGGPWRLVGGPAVVAAASPEPSAPGGDTRSAGEGPGLVGAPFLAILAVLGLGLVTAGATVVYLRLAAGPPDRDRPGSGSRRSRRR